MVTNVAMNMVICVTSVLVLSYRYPGDGIFDSYRTSCIRLGMYTLYIIFGLYRYEEENVVCRKVAMVVSFLLTLHGIFILVYIAIAEPFKNFIQL